MKSDKNSTFAPKMSLPPNAEKIYKQLGDQTRLGDLRNLAKEIKKDHELAKALWSTGELFPRLLAILVMDPKALDNAAVEELFDDIEKHGMEEQTQLADWLLANQLTKNKSLVALIESWSASPSALQRRIFWYHQGRLRWVGQTPPGNTNELLKTIEKQILQEVPEVQWAMNFTAAWIGIWDRSNRDRCIKMGEKLGLYKDEVVHKGCSPNYLPKLIEQEVKKRKLA
jgi:3-methyladenine DNA glycosylase AlkD